MIEGNNLRILLNDDFLMIVLVISSRRAVLRSQFLSRSFVRRIGGIEVRDRRNESFLTIVRIVIGKWIVVNFDVLEIAWRATNRLGRSSRTFRDPGFVLDDSWFLGKWRRTRFDVDVARVILKIRKSPLCEFLKKFYELGTKVLVLLSYYDFL